MITINGTATPCAGANCVTLPYMEDKPMKKSVCLALVLMMVPGLASAKKAYLQAFKANYPNSKTASFRCNICHIGSAKKLNYYGTDYQKANHDFKAIETLDSDGDGVTNIDEINKGTNPGDKASF